MRKLTQEELKEVYDRAERGIKLYKLKENISLLVALDQRHHDIVREIKTKYVISDPNYTRKVIDEITED